MPRSTEASRPYVVLSVVIGLALLRVCFAGVLWSDEDYHMATAIHILQGKLPYRDFWYDKPPLSALYYLLMGATPGVVLRLWDAAYILLCCFLIHRLARSWWGQAEARMSALLFAYFTTFYLPSAVIPFAPDALLLAPHLAAVYFARRGNGWLAGAACGVGLWINVKAVFVFVSCALWLGPSLLALLGGFAAVLAAGACLLLSFGGLVGYWEQVWVWGLAYASGAPVSHPLVLAMERVSHWLGFHSALALSWFSGLRGNRRSDQAKLALWLAFSFATVCFGNHFAPRYFLQLLPPLTVVAARGIVVAVEERRRLFAPLLLLLLLVPFVRFAPRYIRMVLDQPWADVAMNLDSQVAAQKIEALSQPGDTLFVWGYRPDIYVYTRLGLASFFWDSQPLTGVAADRHLGALEPVMTGQTKTHLREMLRSRPTFFVDGLGPLNENLRPETIAEMRELLLGYREVSRTPLTVIYRRKD